MSDVIRLASPLMGDAECEAALKVLRSGMLVHGEQGRAFEQGLAEFFGQKGQVFVVSSGTAALHLALLAMGIGRGDAVIVPDFTFPATANVVEAVGARPILVDVDESTYNITPQGVEAALKAWRGPEKPRAIMPVHEFGCPAKIDAICDIAGRSGLDVIEDAACAIGTHYAGRHVGTFGRVGCFSFHPRKTLTTGEGGAVWTIDEAIADRMRRIRNHGIESVDGRLEFVEAGLNYRLTDFQSAMGRAQLPNLPGSIAHRKKMQALYRQSLAGCDVAIPADVEGHSWQTFMIVLPQKYDRDQVVRELRDKGIETNLGAQALHSQPFYQRKYPADAQRLTGGVAERLFRSGLALPIHQRIEPPHVKRVCEALRAILC